MSGFNLDRMGVPNSERELDTTPVEMPIGSVRPTPLHDLIARMVRQAVSDETEVDFEAFDEADDFEEEDPDTLDLSAYQLSETNEEMTLADWQAAEESEAEPTPHPDDTLPPDLTGDPPNPNEAEPDQA